MHKTQLEVREWLELPLSTRVKLASDFNLMRSGNSEVVDHRVVSDGYLFHDLSKISVDLMRSHLNLTDSEFDFYKLFNLLLQSYEHKGKEGSEDKGTDSSTDETNREEQEVEPIREGSILPEVTPKPKKRGGRTTNASGTRNGSSAGIRKSTKNNIS